jgi:hypothetical protein
VLSGTPIGGSPEIDEETHVWLAFGAPPVGTVDDFGAYVLPDDTQ